MKRMLGAAAALFMCAMLAFPLSAIGFDADIVYDSVFVISTEDAIGSGFAMGENCIITNAHVVENARVVTVSTHDGKEYQANVAVIDAVKDLAVLWVEDITLKSLPVADFSGCKVGDDIYTVGAPENLAYTLTKGIISAKDREVDGQIYVQIDAAVNPGNSGGPLLNDKGQVLGVNTLKLDDSEGIGLSIPITEVMDFLVQNGIELNNEGNVANRIDSSNMPRVSTPSAPDETVGAETTVSNRANPILAGVLCVSVLLNVVLTVVLVFQKRKTPKPKPNPTERTDFEIDIME